jgi:hypothetical protein
MEGFPGYEISDGGLIRSPRKRKRRKPPSRPSHVPHECIVLAVDTAAQSGFCITMTGAYETSGTVSIHTPGAVQRAVDEAHALALDHGYGTGHVVLVLERPWGGNSWTQQALGAARYAWQHAWERRFAKKRVVRVYPATWRARVLGGPSLEAERSVARAITRKRGVMTQDECAAVCIAKWASLAGEVAAVLPTIAKKGRVSR